MHKEIISDKQGTALIVLFIIGSSSIFAQGLEAKKDIWLAFIIGIIMVLPMIMIYARLHFIFPGHDLFSILELCFGKILGKTIIILYTWFVFFFASDIFVNYGQFIRVITGRRIPQIIPIILLGTLAIWGTKQGIEVLGRFSSFFFSIPIIFLTFIVILLIPEMNIDNLQPILQEGITPVLKGAFSVFNFPLVQIVIFTMAFSDLKHRTSSYKIYVTGLLIGTLYLATLSLTNVLVTGVETAARSFYPSYLTVTRVNIGKMIQRIEVVLTTVFMLGGFIKISLLLLCTCKGICKIFEFTDYRFIITPMAILIMNLSYFQYESVMYYFEFNEKIWSYYHLPFQVIFPIVVWIIGELKKKNRIIKDPQSY